MSMFRRCAASLILCAALAGCGNRNQAEFAGAPGYAPPPAPAAAPAAEATVAQARLAEPRPAGDASGGAPRARFLAYAHTLRLETTEEKIAPAHDAAVAACRAAEAEACVVLESQLATGRYVSARLRLRAKPEGIRKVIAALGEQGKVVDMHTTADDLEGPISDTAKQLAMLEDYRGKLEALRARAANDIESLIKVNEQLAQTQSNIEALTGQRAQLAQRVNTELLSVSIESPTRRGSWQPVGDATTGFGGHLAEGIASVITGAAYLGPWLVVLAIFVWLLRWLWRRRKRG